MEALCKIRDIARAIADFETDFQKQFAVSLNEGMALCTLSDAQCLTSSKLAEQLGLSYSNMSKVIKSLESKDYIKRCVGKEDKRQMLFSITESGQQLLADIRTREMVLPEVLRACLAD